MSRTRNPSNMESGMDDYKDYSSRYIELQTEKKSLEKIFTEIKITNTKQSRKRIRNSRGSRRRFSLF